MNTPNQATENMEKKGNNSNYARGIVSEAIGIFSSESDANMARLIAHYLENKPDNTLLDYIKAQCIRVRNGKDKNSPEVTSITEEEISKTLSETASIRRIVLDETSERRSLESSVWHVFKSRYKASIMASENRIRSGIKKEGTSSLKQILKKEENGVTFLNMIGVTIPQKKELAELTEELGINPQTIERDESLIYATLHYLQTGKMGASDLENLIKAQTGMSSEQKKKLVTFFVPAISVNQLESFGLIGADQREKWIFDILNEILRNEGKIRSNQTIFDVINDDTIRHEVGSWMRGTNDVFIQTDRLNDEMMQKFFEKGASGILAAAMSDFSESIGEVQERKVASLADFIVQFKKLGEANNPPFSVRNIEKLSKDTIILSHRGDGKKAWKIVDTDILPENNTSPRRGVRIEAFDKDGFSAGIQFVEYGVLFQSLMDEAKSTSPSVEIVDELPEGIGKTEKSEEERMEDANYFLAYLDRIDTRGKNHGFSNKLAFTVKIKNKIEIYRIEDYDTDRGTFSLKDRYGDAIKDVPKNITLSQFYSILQNSSDNLKFSRIGDFSTLELFVKNSGIPNLLYEHGKLEIHDASNHDDEHHEMKKGLPVWGFQNEDGVHIRTEFDGDMVTVFEYQKYVESKKSKDGKREKEDKMKMTQYPKMNLEGLHVYLKENKFNEPISEDPRTKKEQPIHDDVHFHPHSRGILGKFLGMKSFHDFSKAFEMGTHMITHMLEEQSQMHAAEAMYGFFLKTAGKDSPLTAHALMEFSSKIGKTIDEKVTYINGLGGLPRRREIKHILSTKPPKPHEILAALIVTAEMAGHLYPDSELQDLQGGRYLWFEAVCEALNLPFESELARCKKKVAETNKETSKHPHETQLIERLFKFHQDDNPYIQAIAGGGKYWNAVTAGRSSQKEKGEKEGGQLLGAMDRAEYTITKLCSNEPEIAMGSFPTIYGKDPSAVNLGPAFVWAMSNFPATAHPDVSNTFKNMMDANGVAFHALPFCRNDQMSSIYKATMDVVVHHSGDDGMIAAWQKVQSFKPHGKYTFKEYHIQELWSFWKNYHQKIHPILQLTSPKLSLLSEDPHTSATEKAIIGSYFDTMKAVVSTGRLNDKAPDDTIMKQSGYRFDGGSMIPDIDGNLKSISRILKYIDIKYSGEMDSNHHKTLWHEAILPFIQSIRDDPLYGTNPSFQKRQFVKIHDEIIEFIRQKLNSKYYPDALNKQPYIRELQALGFDMSVENISQEVPLGKEPNYQAENTFANFKNTNSTYTVVSHTADRIAVELGKPIPTTKKNQDSPANDSSYRQAA